nr:hypothetical protein [Fodinicola feengrottensis]
MVAALSVSRPPAPSRQRPLWTDRTGLLHAPAMPGKDRWRASGLPG